MGVNALAAMIYYGVLAAWLCASALKTIIMSNDYPEIGHIWDIAELLRGDYKRSDYGKVILPFTVLRRLDSILAPTKAAVLQAAPEAT